MLKKIYNFLHKKNHKYRDCDGFTLVEMLVSVFLIALLVIGLLHGTSMALLALELNKEKTQAVAVANEKIEFLKAMDYEDIGLTADSPGWEMGFPELAETGYNVYYYSTWVDEEEDSYKQIMVSVLNSDMNVPVELVTQIYPPLGSSPEPEPGYPAPVDLIITGDSGYGSNRDVGLSWTAPDTERIIAGYNLYRNGEFISDVLTETYVDSPGDDEEYVYYVTTFYDDSTESDPSNSVTTSAEPYYATPEELEIDSYIGSGSNREVLFSWGTPDTPYTIIEYRVYREGSYIESTQDEFYQDLIGAENYTYYVTAYYEGDNESEPSNSVITEQELTYPAPQNLQITGYSGGTGNNKRVYLAWEAPDSPLSVIEYRIYWNGFDDSTTDTSINIKIGKVDYTFYVTALYEGGIESDPSNTVTTQ